MSVGLAVLLVSFVVLLLLEVPVAFVIGIATLLGALALGLDGAPVSVARWQIRIGSPVGRVSRCWTATAVPPFGW